MSFLSKNIFLLSFITVALPVNAMESIIEQEQNSNIANITSTLEIIDSNIKDMKNNKSNIYNNTELNASTQLNTQINNNSIQNNTNLNASTQLNTQVNNNSILNNTELNNSTQLNTQVNNNSILNNTKLNTQVSNDILQSTIKINPSIQQDKQIDNNIQIHINNDLQNNIQINANNENNIPLNNIINNNIIKITDDNKQTNIDVGSLLKEIVSDLKTQNKILNNKQLYSKDEKQLECITIVENENKEVIKNKLNRVVLKLQDNKLIDLKRKDVLRWVRQAIEKIPDTMKDEYSRVRKYFEKKLTNARQLEMDYLDNHNLQYKQKNEYKYYNNYYKDNKSYMNNKLKSIQNKIKQQQSNINNINVDFYKYAQDEKLKVINQLSNDDMECSFNNIPTETVNFILLENNSIFEEIGNSRTAISLYNNDSKIKLSKYKPINGISNIKYYNDINKLLNLVYDNDHNEILKDYTEPVYNIVKYGLVVPAVNNFINGVLVQEHSVDCGYTGWISSLKPIDDNQCLLTIMNNKTNNVLKLNLNLTDEKCNIALNTLFNDHPIKIQKANVQNQNYYKKYFNKKSYK